VLDENGLKPEKSVPVLIELLEKRGDGSEIVRALLDLQRLGRRAVGAAPAVRRLLEEDIEFPRAAVTLARIDPDDPAAVRALMARLKHPDAGQRAEAARELSRLGPAARAAVPRLEEALREPGDYVFRDRVRLTAAAALIRITGHDEPYAGILRRGLKANPWELYLLGELAADRPWALAALSDLFNGPLRHRAVDAVKYAGSAGRRLIPDVISVLRTEIDLYQGTLRSYALPTAVSVLGTYGPDAKDAIPVLRELLLQVNREDAEHIEAVLRQIEGTLPR
jgi:HEAT repeat protein